MKTFFKILPIVITLFTINDILAQEIILKGKVICFNTYAVNGANVKSSKTKQETKTDSLGNFSIKIREKSDVLRISAKGFSPLRYKVSKGQDSVSLNMIFIDSRKNEEMVTSYGYISQKNLTFALTNLTDENSFSLNYVDIYDMIEGRVVGIRVDRSTNPPSVNIRDNISINASTEPLYIVDGIPTDPANIATIQPSQVKQISVIKDGQASEYGMQGANGVIIITLKKSK